MTLLIQTKLASILVSFAHYGRAAFVDFESVPL